MPRTPDPYLRSRWALTIEQQKSSALTIARFCQREVAYADFPPDLFESP